MTTLANLKINVTSKLSQAKITLHDTQRNTPNQTSLFSFVEVELNSREFKKKLEDKIDAAKDEDEIKTLGHLVDKFLMLITTINKCYPQIHPKLSNHKFHSQPHGSYANNAYLANIIKPLTNIIDAADQLGYALCTTDQKLSQAGHSLCWSVIGALTGFQFGCALAYLVTLASPPVFAVWITIAVVTSIFAVSGAQEGNDKVRKQQIAYNAYGIGKDDFTRHGSLFAYNSRKKAEDVQVYNHLKQSSYRI